MTRDELREKARLLPASPGVYLMLDKAGEIIYVGKAKALKNRVSSYFLGHDQSLKTRQLVARISDFNTIFAKTEFDALLLESTLIKKHKPKYNILLKDDKGYPFVRLEKGAYPRFTVVTRKGEDGARYFGPFGGRGSAFNAIKLICETFQLPTCSRVFPRDIGKDRPCLMFHLEKCCGVCDGSVSAQEYDAILKQAALLLDGKSDRLEALLTQRMEAAAEDCMFEQAAMLRDRLYAVRKLKNHRIVVGVTGADIDVLAYSVRGARACITVLSYNGGSLIDKKYRFFDGLGELDAADALGSFVKQYYSQMGKAPKELYLSHEVDEQEALEEYVTSLRGSRSHILLPQRGEKRKMVDLALENGTLELLTMEQREQKSRKTMELLQGLLGTDTPPNRMEAFDISNTAGADAVASMTVHVEGKPLKKAYKRFKIKEAAGGDDYGSMAEVVGRRLDRALAGDESFLPLPDVLLMDGGAGQVSVALSELKKRELDIPIYGMVKDAHHRTRALIAADGREIGLTATPAVFALIGRIQEETHRFAIEYHHTLRSKSVKTSVLDQIDGVGEERRKALLRRFKSVKAISAATAEELGEIVPKNVADNVYRHFHPAQEQEEAQ